MNTSSSQTSTDRPQPGDSAARPAPTPRVASRWSRLWARFQFILCLGLTAGVLGYLLWGPEARPRAAAEDQPSAAPESVRLVSHNHIRVVPGCPLCQMLQVATVKPVEITDPVLTVTGTVVASLRPAPGKDTDCWQFNTPELLTAYTDWQKAASDIEFSETQLGQIRQLAETRISAQEKLVERMKRLVAAGTDTEKDLAAAQAELIQAQIQGRKEIHEAETAVRLARRTEAALARQIQQAGLEPELLRAGKSDVDIVMADVPEGMVTRVRPDQACQARFFGLPNLVFSGHVRAIAPVLSKEHRSLRVLFAIRDPQDLLRPGMFADIGLGTDPRPALLMPPEGIVHVGRSDYALVCSNENDFRVTEVQVGELHDQQLEILGGLSAGDRVAGKGVILLKPIIIEALQSRRNPVQADASPLPIRPARGVSRS